MPLYGARAEEHPPGDLGVRRTVAGQPGDLPLLRGQLISPLQRPLAHLLACRQQLTPGPLAEALHADRREPVVGRAELLPGVDAALLTAQPLSVEQMRAGELGT